MASLSPHQAQVIASWAVRGMSAEICSVAGTPVHVAIHPSSDSAGLRRALWMRMYPEGSVPVHLAIDAVANTTGPNSAYLKAGQYHEFGINPEANTVCFLTATYTTIPTGTSVRITWAW